VEARADASEKNRAPMGRAEGARFGSIRSESCATRHWFFFRATARRATPQFREYRKTASGPAAQGADACAWGAFDELRPRTYRRPPLSIPSGVVLRNINSRRGGGSALDFSFSPVGCRSQGGGRLRVILRFFAHALQRAWDAKHSGATSAPQCRAATTGAAHVPRDRAISRAELPCERCMRPASSAASKGPDSGGQRLRFAVKSPPP